MSKLEDNSEPSYPLHECVFKGDVRKLSSLLRTEDVALKDKHGNTALHLAVMLGRKECVQLLLAHGAPVKLKNLAGWSPLAEAISYGDRPTILSLVRKLKQQAREQMETRRPDLIKALTEIQDFYMELKWDFHSWVPLVSRILPSDVCKIYKWGAAIRLDTTLVDFTDMKWERGDISFIFRGDTNALTVLDNQNKVFQKIRYEETESEMEDEVDILMSTDILAAQMSTKGIIFNRAQSGWIFRENRRETVAGIYNSDIYTISGLVLESRKRREHLSNDDLQKNKALIERLRAGQAVESDTAPIRRASLNPPPECEVDWETYIESPAGEYPPLGRPLVFKESSRTFRATVAMSDNFPLSVSTLLNVLEIIAPFKHFDKLRQFIAMKLPTGFPVKVDLPILPTVTAKITFQSFSFCDDFGPEQFYIPEDYFEDPHRFPDL